MTGPHDDALGQDWEPSETDCREALERVYSYIDGEIPDEEKLRIRQHLDECAPCLRQYGIEQEVKVLIARCCGAETASRELRSRVLSRIAQVRIEISSVEYRPE
ncbi:MAG TPA: mycothiol system anti-sigma-R factor [Actinomycetes bacterium]|nr:mycothiol system anti-sigma-R factor [Actinomycetes bacterium]